MLCGLLDAFDLGKQELNLKDRLTVKVEKYCGYKKLKIIILLDGEVISTNLCVL